MDRRKRQTATDRGREGFRLPSLRYAFSRRPLSRAYRPFVGDLEGQQRVDGGRSRRRCHVVSVGHRPYLVLAGANEGHNALRADRHMPRVGNKRVKVDMEPRRQLNLVSICLTASAFGPVCGTVGQSIGAVMCIPCRRLQRVFGPSGAKPPIISAANAAAETKRSVMLLSLGFLIVGSLLINLGTSRLAFFWRRRCG